MRELSTWIRLLIAEDKLYKFYKSKEWRLLRRNILEKCHYECEECLKRGRVTRAREVHHVNEVKHRPDLALSEYYTDEKGEKKRNLKALCMECHNKEHGRFTGGEYRPQLNKERW